MSRSGKARALSPRLGLLCGHYVVVEELKGELANTRLKYIELKDDLAAVQFGLTNRLVKVARAAGVEHVLDTNRI